MKKEIKIFLEIMLRKTGFQILLLTPVFWLNELAQNFLYHCLTGRWGWFYPQSPQNWFTFMTLLNWMGGVAIIFVLYQKIFFPRKIRFLFRIGLLSIIGFAGEFLSNFLISLMMGKLFIVWEGSFLVHIGWLALPLWCWNALLFEWLYSKLNRRSELENLI